MVLTIYKILVMSSVAVLLIFVQSATSNLIIQGELNNLESLTKSNGRQNMMDLQGAKITETKTELYKKKDDENEEFIKADWKSINPSGPFNNVIKTSDHDIRSTYKHIFPTKTIVSSPCCDKLPIIGQQILKIQDFIDALELENAKSESKIKDQEEEIVKLKAKIEDNPEIIRPRTEKPTTEPNNNLIEDIIYPETIKPVTEPDSDVIKAVIYPETEKPDNEPDLDVIETVIYPETKEPMIEPVTETIIKPKIKEPVTESGKDVIEAVINALNGHEDLKLVQQYLNMSTDLQLDNSSDGSGFTFFAPTDFIFEIVQQAVDMDIFNEDAEFRRQILLRHFVLKNLSKDDLAELTTIQMADLSMLNVTQRVLIEAQSNQIATLIDGAIIGEKVIELEPAGLGMIYVIRRIFATDQEIYDAVDEMSTPEL